MCASVREHPQSSYSTAAHTGWSALFWDAFTQSKNAMVLLDDERRHVEVNGAHLQLLGYPRSALLGLPIYDFVEDGPLVTRREWRSVLRTKQFTAVAPLIRGDGGRVTVEFAGHPEIVTGRQLVLFVALRVSRGNRRLVDHAQSASPRPLTNRELDVIALLARGYTGAEAAAELHVAHNTVRTHVQNSMSKLGVRSRAQLVARSLAESLIWPDEH